MKKAAVLFLITSFVVCSACLVYLKHMYAEANDIIVDIGNAEILSEFGIVPAKDLQNEGSITEREALNIISRIMDRGDPVYLDFSKISKEWYTDNAFAPLDDIPDEDKLLIYRLSGRRLTILSKDEIRSLDLDKELTNKQALLYALRLNLNIYEEDRRKNPNEVYDAAFAKELISQNNNTAAQLSIARKDLYALLANAMTYRRYSYYWESYGYSIEDRFRQSMEEEPETRETAREIKEEKITADVTFGGDMSISWTVGSEDVRDPREPKFEFFNSDGESIPDMSKIYSDNDDNFIDAKELLHYVIAENPAERIKISYRCYENDSLDFTKKSFDIELPDIKVVTEGEPLRPGVYCDLGNVNRPYEISFDNAGFKKDRYYIITSREDKYRLPEMNESAAAVLTVKKDTDVYKNISQTIEYSGDIYNSEIHIREAYITGDPQNGFVVHITPESEEFERTVL